MKLDRSDGHKPGKYAVVKLRDMTEPRAWENLDGLATGGFVRFEKPGDADEFMVIFLKDKYAATALFAYAAAAEIDDPEYAREVRELAARAGPNSKYCKRPD